MEETRGASFTVYVRYEQDDPLVETTKRWSTTYAGGRSGGSFIRSDKRYATASVAFVGTSVAWISPAGPWFGVARVSVDGEPGELVDLHSPVAASNVWTRSGSPYGEHTLQVEWTGLAGGGGTGIGVDAFDVDGYLVPRRSR